ncbi:hypothetical protein T190130A13A_120029 [Tenacibaculum sp. 190130A14a]|uniref:Uncharacterized protein n=1 Tax=Tenacibaculum polynesiense TaxID=3137857 RepID=A0ABM9P7K0_9FLAO
MSQSLDSEANHFFNSSLLKAIFNYNSNPLSWQEKTKNTLLRSLTKLQLVYLLQRQF